MKSSVFRLHSTLELPLEDVHDFFEDPELPVEIDDIEIKRRNNTLIISSIAAEENLSKYTPTAQLKASVTENRVYENEDGEWQETPPDDEPGGAVASSGSGGGPSWSSLGGEQEAEEEVRSKLMEYACFKGDRETVLQNTELQYPMFEVLCNLARTADKGSLEAIVAVSGDLEAVRVVDGEDRPARVKIVEDPREQENGGVDWRDNEFIN
ncbi:hypothetical protein DP107_15570 [Haloglomus irregulare]|uniref:Uncharacterized protein n=1 Tax=Haloglomus irregulare TaxID=2234134 RepID=A0A554MWQ7_9EURY|nr:hypothetical protein [Haloglomus irregulare]TSD09557.1 hypothetical protein DP107_15570 [Haloglomus irregulare]